VSLMSDNAQEARHLFRLVSFVCSLVFGIPLAVILLKMAGELFGGPVAAASYQHLAVRSDAIYATILTGLLMVPMLASYLYYRWVTE
jgi:hypothetical protein